MSSTEVETMEYLHAHTRDLSGASDATIVPRRNTTPEHPVRTHEPLRTRISRVLAWAFVSGGTLSMPTLVLLCFVPILGFLILPALAALAAALVYGISHLAYLLLAQQDAPPKRSLPFLAWGWTRCLLVDRAVFMYLREGARFLALLWTDWFYRKIARSKVRITRNIHHGSPRPNMRLDVYTPLSSSESEKMPVIVFLAPQLRFLPRGRTLFASLGRNLSASLKCIVVVPDIAAYPAGRLPQQIEDTRLVLRWVAERYPGGAVGHGDGVDAESQPGPSSGARRVFLAGHGLSGLLALLVPVQQAVVHARDMQESAPKTRSKRTMEVPNGIRDLTIYAREVIIPELAGLILFAPIADVDKHIIHESVQGVHNISLVRRVCGPTQVTSLQHSPSHLLYASRNFDVKRRLPSRVLLLHGGLDQSVEHVQSEITKELLRGIGLRDVRLSVYEEVGHWGVILGQMGRMRGSTSKAVTSQLFSFVHDH